MLEPQPYKARKASLRKISPRLANHLVRLANQLGTACQRLDKWGI
jgi:hypothetical protein